MTPTPAGDPFRALGLPPTAAVPDDEVRAAWRRVASATHPDRADGGDPAAFAAAAAAYTSLRTRLGRTEALADLAQPGATAPPARRPGIPWRAGRRWRVLSGRGREPWPRGARGRLLARAAAAAVISAAAVWAGGPHPASAAVATGCLTWLISPVFRR